MYTRFSGENGQSAARWLRTLKYELPPAFTAGQWLECVDGLLDGEAARWADEQPAVKKFLSDKALEYARNYDVDIFKALFLSRFTPGEGDLEGVNHLLENLRQDPAEFLEVYYRRAENLLHALGGRDEIYPAVLGGNERSILTRVISRFVGGLCEPYMKPDVLPEWDSLRQTYEKVANALDEEWGIKT